jgi:hypothetical protein
VRREREDERGEDEEDRDKERKEMTPKKGRRDKSAQCGAEAQGRSSNPHVTTPVLRLRAPKPESSTSVIGAGFVPAPDHASCLRRCMRTLHVRMFGSWKEKLDPENELHCGSSHCDLPLPRCAGVTPAHVGPCAPSARSRRTPTTAPKQVASELGIPHTHVNTHTLHTPSRLTAPRAARRPRPAAS